MMKVLAFILCFVLVTVPVQAALHKMVSGKKVMLTAQEESDLRAQWAVNEAELLDEKTARESADTKLRKKLTDLGFTEAESDLIL